MLRIVPEVHFYCVHADLVVIWRILCSKLQLSDDDFIRPHFHVAHAFQDCSEVGVIQSVTCSANQSREHMDVRSQSCFLRKTESKVKKKEGCLSYTNTIHIIVVVVSFICKFISAASSIILSIFWGALCLPKM